MSESQAIVVTGAIKVGQKLIRGAGNMRPVVTRELLRGATRTMGHMKDRYLSGNPLKVQTGKLRGGWNVRAVSSSAHEVVVSMHTATKYAPAQNWGFHGMVTVKAHSRRIKAKKSKPRKGGKRKQLRTRSEARASAAHTQNRAKVTQAAHGMSLRAKQKQSRDARGQGRIGSAFPKELSAQARGSGIQLVPSHSRFMKLRGHRFVERSIRDTRAQVVQDVAAQVSVALLGRA